MVVCDFDKDLFVYLLAEAGGNKYIAPRAIVISFFF